MARRNVVTTTSLALAAGCLLLAAHANADDVPAGSTAASPPAAPLPYVSPPPAARTTTTTHLLLTTEPPPPIVAYESHWYGWQTLLADVGAIGVGVAAKEPAIFALSYSLVPPVIHFAHGNVARGFVSLGLRVLAPAAGALVGLVIGTAIGSGDKSDPFGGLGDMLGGFVAGAGVGYVSAIAIDAAALSWDHDPVSAQPSDQAPPPQPPKASSFTFSPRFAITPKGGGQLGLAGTF